MSGVPWMWQIPPTSHYLVVFNQDLHSSNFPTSHLMLHDGSWDDELWKFGSISFVALVTRAHRSLNILALAVLY